MEMRVAQAHWRLTNVHVTGQVHEGSSRKPLIMFFFNEVGGGQKVLRGCQK